MFHRSVVFGLEFLWRVDCGFGLVWFRVRAKVGLGKRPSPTLGCVTHSGKLASIQIQPPVEKLLERPFSLNFGCKSCQSPPTFTGSVQSEGASECVCLITAASISLGSLFLFRRLGNWASVDHQKGDPATPASDQADLHWELQNE